ncbi:MAG: RNA 3'-terminal phosphate cyclase [Candidatus Thermoplasmatota archaeon]
MLEIDGSFGEGGGQILRTALSFSVLTKKPFRLVNIRAKRPNPGLAKQHITAIETLKKISNSTTNFVSVGSKEIEFFPGDLEGGEYSFDIGTAGSITLVLQSAILPALFGNKETKLLLKGGTDVKWAPPIDYITHVFLQILRKMGAELEIEVLSRGYYPKGGGLVCIMIRPSILKKFYCNERGSMLGIFGKINITNLNNSIAERMEKTARAMLAYENFEIVTERCKGIGTGVGILLFANFENTVIGSDSLGEIGLPAEKVVEFAVKEMTKELDSFSTVDVHAADMLLPYIAVAGGGSFYVREITEHTRTNIEIIKKFLDVEFKVESGKIECEKK